jgi:hypothetical protein
MVRRKTDDLAHHRVLFEGAWSVYDPPFVRSLGSRALQARLRRAASLIVIVVLSLGLWVAIWAALDKAAALL